MTDPRNESENEESFSLRRKNKREKNSADSSESSTLSWQEHAYERLKVLYGVGKLLSSFDSVETSFPKILTLCAGTFPFLTAVLIEKRGKKFSTAIWHAANADKAQIERAVTNAKESFIYLTGASLPDASDLKLNNTAPSQLEVHVPIGSPKTNPNNYIVLPLLVDNLPAFGVIQLEGAVPLNEKDLEFVNALGDLLAVAVDRHFKTQLEREWLEREVGEASSKLSSSQAHVENLKDERELRERFVSLLSHDLRTPLSAVKISAQLIQRKEDTSESTLSLAARIVSNVNRADQMISDLLDANRIRSGEKLPLKIEQFDLITLARETLDDLATIHGDRFILSGLEHIEGYWDRASVRRIIENLCNNAIKYGSPTSPINVLVRKISENACIEVQNSGELITREDQASLFQQFRRGPKAQGSKKKGWGIGLTIVRGIAEAHGGTVQVESEATKGTIFRIVLPIDSRPFLPRES